MRGSGQWFNWRARWRKAHAKHTVDKCVARCHEQARLLGRTAGATKNGNFGARSFASAASNESLDVKANKRVGVMEVQRDPAVTGRVL